MKDLPGAWCLVTCLPTMQEDPGSISGLRRSPGEGNGNPLQCSCLKKSHAWRSLVGYSPWGRKESDMTERFHFTWLMKIFIDFILCTKASTDILSSCFIFIVYYGNDFS